MPRTRDELKSRKSKIALLFIIISFFLAVLVARFFYIYLTDAKNFPNLYASDTDTSLRGFIKSGDDFTLSSSKKLYKAEVNTYTIDPDKKELFIKLFSIYSGMDEDKVRKKLDSKKGRVVISYKIDSKRAFYLKELAKKLYNLRIFREYEDKKRNVIYRNGLDILESGEYREYKYKDLFTPYIGYVRKRNDDHGFTRGYGVKGLERYYDTDLKPIQDGYIYGKRDIVNNIIFNGSSKVVPRIDGASLYLNINLKLQKFTEVILDKFKKELDAKEIVACVMESKSSKIIALATTNRYNPNRIRKTDYPFLNITAVEYAYEPGSVMKPIVLSLLLAHKLVNPYEIIDTHNGRYYIKNYLITDDHRYKKLSVENIIVHSSNIGISILSQRLDAIDFFEGLKRFGFSKRSGVDLSYDKKGKIPSVLKMQDEVYKATTAYGYGIEATFMQLMKAYNAFNNEGVTASPKIASHLRYFNQKLYPITENGVRIIPAEVARTVKKILIKTVNEGTGKAAITPGIEVGGKTGTAHISRGRGYEKKYNSSFFGFANDKEHKFTIGVLVREPKTENYSYFASKSAVPVFKAIVDELINEGYLKRE